MLSNSAAKYFSEFMILPLISDDNSMYNIVSKDNLVSEEKAHRPDSLPVEVTAAIQMKAVSKDVVTMPSRPPPLTPVLMHKMESQSTEADKSGSQSSTLKGISLQGEIGAFEKILERSLEKSKDLGRDEALRQLQGNVHAGQKGLQQIPQLYQHDASIRAQLPARSMSIQMHPRLANPQHVDRYQFIPPASRTALEQSSAVQAFSTRLPTMMSTQPHPTKGFPQAAQDSAPMSRHFQYPQSHMHPSQESTHLRTAQTSTPIGHIESIRGPSPRPAVLSSVDSRDYAHAFQKQGQYMFPHEVASSIHPTTPGYSREAMTHFRSAVRTSEPNTPRSAVSGYPNPHEYQPTPEQISHKGVLYPNPNNRNELLMKTAEHFKQYQQHSLMNPADERTFSGKHFDSGKHFEQPYPMTTKEQRPRQYMEMRERAASIPSLTMNRPSSVPHSMAKAMPVENVTSGNVHARHSDKSMFEAQQHSRQSFESTYEMMMKSRVEALERLNPRVADRREQIMMEQALAQKAPPLYSEHLRQLSVDPRFCKQQNESPDMRSLEHAGTPPPVSVDPRMIPYLEKGMMPPMFQAGRECRPSLDHQLLRNIDPRMQPNVDRNPVAHQTKSSIYQPQSGAERMPFPSRSHLLTKRDDFQRASGPSPNAHVEEMNFSQGRFQRGNFFTASDEQQLIPHQPRDTKIEAHRKYYDTSPSQQHREAQGNPLVYPPEKYASSDPRYGISTGVVQRAPPRMSITGSSRDEPKSKSFETATREHASAHPEYVSASSQQFDLRNVEFVQYDKSAIPARRAATLKSMSRNTRPSSVDSVRHKPFFTEKQQQLSSSLGDLRNLAVLHLSPTLPISPTSTTNSGRNSPCMFRPWEKEAGVKPSGDTQDSEPVPANIARLKSGNLPRRSPLTIDPESTKPKEVAENVYDEPLMSPTIPYPDPGHETPVKDIEANDENMETELHRIQTDEQMTSQTANDITEPFEIVESIPVRNEGLRMSVDFRRSPSPVDSEATLSADEDEMKMMQVQLTAEEANFIQGKISGQYRQGTGASSAESKEPNVFDLGESRPTDERKYRPTGSKEIKDLSIDKEPSSAAAILQSFTGKDFLGSMPPSYIDDNRVQGGLNIRIKQHVLKDPLQHEVASHTETVPPDMTLAVEKGVTEKTKGKRKQKAVSKGKKRSPRSGDKKSKDTSRRTEEIIVTQSLAQTKASQSNTMASGQLSLQVDAIKGSDPSVFTFQNDLAAISPGMIGQPISDPALVSHSPIGVASVSISLASISLSPVCLAAAVYTSSSLATGSAPTSFQPLDDTTTITPSLKDLQIPASLGIYTSTEPDSVVSQPLSIASITSASDSMSLTDTSPERPFVSQAPDQECCREALTVESSVQDSYHESLTVAASVTSDNMQHLTTSDDVGLTCDAAKEEADDAGFNESHGIVDVEETSAAIDSIQNEGIESPSAEEDVVDPFLALWPAADDYSCDATTEESTAEESDYQSSYNVGISTQNAYGEESSEVKAQNTEQHEEGNFRHDFSDISIPDPREMVTAIEGTNMNFGAELLARNEIQFQNANAGNLATAADVRGLILPAQAEDDIYLSNYATSPISPPGSPISPAETPSTITDIPMSDGPPSFAHSVLSLNIPVTSQGSPKTHLGAVAFPYSSLSLTMGSRPTSLSGSIHGSRSNSACASPNPLAVMQNSPSNMHAGTLPRSDLADDNRSISHSDNLRHLTERLLHSDSLMQSEDHMALNMDFSQDRDTEMTSSTVNYTSTMTYEPLSDED